MRRLKGSCKCNCASCDFDRRMAETLNGSYELYTTGEFQQDHMLGARNPIAFAYNMDEYTNVLLESDMVWMSSYH